MLLRAALFLYEFALGQTQSLGEGAITVLTEPLTILLAEDDPGHARLIQRNLNRAGIANEVVHVSDGAQVLDYVRRNGEFRDREARKSLLLVLDINMPRIDGPEVLRQIRSDQRTARIPAVMLTTTDDPGEIERCYDLGCNLYITKPVEYEAFVEVVKRLGQFLQIVQFPQEREAMRLDSRPSLL